MARLGVLTMLAVTFAARPAFAETPVETVLRAAEAALAEAMRARDADALRQIVAEDFATADGTPLDRAAWIDRLLPLCGSGRVSAGNMQVAVRVTTALVSYEATIDRDTACQPAASRIRVAHVWSLSDGVWRLALRSTQSIDDASAAPPDPPPPATPSEMPPEPPAAPEWNGSLEVTVLSTRGNVNTFTFGSTGELTWQQGPWQTNVRGGFLRTTTDLVEDRYSVNLQLRQSRRLSPVVELFGRALYQRDLFAGILRRYGADAGVGFVLVHDGQRLQANLGAGSTEEARVNAPVQSGAISTAGLQYRYSLTDMTSITEETLLTSSLSDTGNWRIESTLAFTTVLRQPFQLRTSYLAKYSRLPVPGFEPFDGILSVALTARF